MHVNLKTAAKYDNKPSTQTAKFYLDAFADLKYMLTNNLDNFLDEYVEILVSASKKAANDLFAKLEAATDERDNELLNALQSEYYNVFKDTTASGQ